VECISVVSALDIVHDTPMHGELYAYGSVKS